MRTWIVAFTLLFLGSSIGACGADSKGSTSEISVSGVMNGVAYTAHSGAFDSVGESILILALSDAADICKLAEGSSAMPQLLVWLNLDLCMIGANGIGDYTIQAGNPGIPCTPGAAWGTVRQFSASSVASEVPATNGTVSVTASASQELSGTMSIQLADGSVTQGAFSVSNCAALNK